MKRREFISLLGGAAAAWPVAASAQQPARPVVGFLRSTSPADSAHFVSAFRQGLKEAGFVEGQNIAVEYRYAAGQNERLPALVADLMDRQVAVIAGNAVAMRAAKDATTTIPIVFVGSDRPLQHDLVASLNRPGGNVTGILFFSGSLGAKRLDLLRQLLPRATAIAMLASSITPESEAERDAVQAAAQAIGQQLIVREVRSVSDLDVAFAAFVQRAAGAMLAGAGPFIFSNSERIVTLAARYAIPAMYATREPVTLGGLMSYASSLPDAYHQAGIYVGRILKGERPGELPVMRSTKFEFVLNLKTARTLGLDIPPTLLALADEVIE